jgi:hypothetical protein
MKVPALPSVKSADEYVLSLFPWQIIGALSFARAGFSEGKQVARFKAALRKLIQLLDVRYRDIVWALKLEWGRWGDRPHFHFVLTGLSPSQLTRATCHKLQILWTRKGGGREADVELFDPAKHGLAYIAKSASVRLDDSIRSTAKFGVNGEHILFSENHVEAAKQYVS